MPGSDLLNETVRGRIIAIAESQLTVRERGYNAGPGVRDYLKYVGMKEGEPWCAAFVSWVYGQGGCRQPRTAWSPALFVPGRKVGEPQPADVLGIYFENLKRIGHCGIVESADGSWVRSIEGNTNAAGSREGDGVYRKRRNRRTIAAWSSWL